MFETKYSNANETKRWKFAELSITAREIPRAKMQCSKSFEELEAHPLIRVIEHVEQNEKQALAKE